MDVVAVADGLDLGEAGADACGFPQAVKMDMATSKRDAAKAAYRRQ